MRRAANALLLLMAVVSLVCRLLPQSWPAMPYLAAFAGAGLVGAIADWFAVTALFRRPLGLPIPHTAIIPRSKARIGEALGEFIAGNFLEPRVLDAKLTAMEPARRLGQWLAAPANAAALARRIAEATPQIASAGPALADLISAGLRRLAGAGELSPLAGRILAYVWRDAGGRRLVEGALESLADYLLAHPGLLDAAVEARTWSWLPKWLDRAVAERLTRALADTLLEMRQADHPLRRSLDEMIERLIARLQGDPAMIAQGEALKARLLADPGLLQRLVEALSTAARRLASDPRAMADVVEPLALRALQAIGGWLVADPLARRRIDLWIRIALRRTLSPGREAIGRFVAQVVASWDARDAAARLELQVGRDLQFIRINGALVGGAAGLALFALLKLLP
jgi:uncharacterized membrane-anchored protein YjiN (DUF445 family)